VGIPGSPPSLKNPLPGCRFAARCPKATDECHTISPIYREVEHEHFAACHLLNKEGI